MDTSFNVANAWQRLLRQNLLSPNLPLTLEQVLSAAASDRRFAEGTVRFADSADALPMLYRSEAFAEDLIESHPPVTC